MSDNWYAVYTKPRWEKKVANVLTQMHIQNYCPLNRITRQWSDRKKIIYTPLFTSYVFVNISEKHFSALRKVDGIINIVFWLGKPAVIKDCEIEAIKNFLTEYTDVQLERTNVKVNDTVRITKGPLLNKEGTIVAIKNNIIKVFLPSLGYTLFAELDKSNVAKVS